MKRDNLLYVSVGVLLLMLVAACSKDKPNYTEVIPLNATQVLSIRLNHLAEKSDLSNPANAALLERLQNLLAGELSSEHSAHLKEIMNHPKEAGIDFLEPVYVFSTPQFPKLVMTAKVVDKNKLEKTIRALNEGNPIRKSEAFLYTYLPQVGMVVAYSNQILMGIQTEETDNEQAAARKQLNRFFALKAEENISNRHEFKLLQEQKNDIGYLCDLRKLTGPFPDHIRQRIESLPYSNRLQWISGLNFEKGKVVFSTRPFSQDTRLQNALDEFAACFQLTSDAFLRFFPASTWAIASCAVNGKALATFLKNNQIAKDLLPESDNPAQSLLHNLLEQVNGQITFGLLDYPVISGPSFLAYAQLNDPLAIDRIYQSKDQLPARYDLKKISDHEYTLEANINFLADKQTIYMGIKENHLYLSNNPKVFKHAVTEQINSLAQNDYFSNLQNKRFSFVVNADEIANHPFVKMGALMDDPQISMGLTALQMISYLEISSSQNISVAVQLKNKEDNFLKQVFELAKQYLGF